MNFIEGENTNSFEVEELQILTEKISCKKEIIRFIPQPGSSDCSFEFSKSVGKTDIGECGRKTD
jgi:hypothetical protein